MIIVKSVSWWQKDHRIKGRSFKARKLLEPWVVLQKLPQMFKVLMIWFVPHGRNHRKNNGLGTKYLKARFTLLFFLLNNTYRVEN